MSVPGIPGTDLVVVESDLILRGSEAFFDRPARPGHVDELSAARAVRVVAAVESKPTIVDGSAEQILLVGTRGVNERPVVDPKPFRPDELARRLPPNAWQ